MTKKLRQCLTAALLLATCVFSGGCVKAARDGFTNGVTTGITAVVVQIIGDGFDNANGQDG